MCLPRQSLQASTNLFCISAAIAEFKKTGKSLIAHRYYDPSLCPLTLVDESISTVDAGIKWRPELSEISEFGPEFKEVWDSYFASAPDKPMLWIGVASAYVCFFGLLSLIIIFC